MAEKNKEIKQDLHAIEVSLNSMLCLFRPSSASAIFQELVSVVLNGCNASAIAYLDDILIFSETFEEHMLTVLLLCPSPTGSGANCFGADPLDVGFGVGVTVSCRHNIL